MAKQLNFDSNALGSYLSLTSFWIPDYIDNSAWIEHSPFALWLMQAHQPKVFVELGTYQGFSYLTFCQAVKYLGLDARCYAIDTWKGDEYTGLYGKEVFERLSNYHNQHYSEFSELIRSTFDNAVKYFEDKSIDLLHIDGSHQYSDVRHDFETWKPKLSDRAVVVFHRTSERSTSTI